MADIALRVFAKKATVTYLDTSVKNLFTLPKNAMVMAFLVDVDTGFNDSGTDLLDIGVTGTADHFANNVNVATAGQVWVQEANLGDSGDNHVVVTATYTGQNSNATTGTCTVTCLYGHYKRS